MGRSVDATELGGLRVVCSKVVVGYLGLSRDYFGEQFLEGAAGLEEASFELYTIRWYI
jgi:hypothetical protein